MMRGFLLATAAVTFAGHAGSTSVPTSAAGTPTSFTGDVVVYGASAPGCAAAIAAARSGARSVVLASPYLHIGGMTTGGIMHADVGNESTIFGVTREFFERVESHYPHPHPSPSPSPSPKTYGCLAQRCLLLPSGAAGSASATCGGGCKQLAPDEWLAVRQLSVLSNGNRTLTVALPRGQATSYIKKGEPLAHTMPASMSQEVKEGQVIRLARPAVSVDDTYDLIQLAEAGAGAGAARPVPPPVHPGAPPGWLYESHVAEQVLQEMLAESNITVVKGLEGLASAAMGGPGGTVLASVTSETGVTLAGTVWIDGTYEGDLAYVAGADMTWGREAVSQYDEPNAGVTAPSIHYAVDPYWPDGSVIPHVSADPVGAVGTADKRIEVYDFRLCFTDSPSHRIPFWKPAGYNASEWELWRRIYAQSGPPDDLRAAGLSCIGPVPNNYTDCGDQACHKCDMLGMKHGTDMLNGAWGYPNATTAQRKAIRKAHIEYITGLLWFWATDPASGDAVHEEMATLGHCNDEYLNGNEDDPPHWPYQLYVREARRLVGDFVWTEHDPPPAIMQRSIGLGAYTFDCHWVSLYVEEATALGSQNARNATVAAEGRVNNGHNEKPAGGVGQAPFTIPYDTLLPKAAQVTNLLVPVAASVTHIRQNAIRMEPTWMIMGHGAGAAAAMAVRAGNPNVHQVDVPALQQLLIGQKQMIWP